MSHHPVWVGVDLGTQSVRVVALADDGRALGTQAVPLFSRRTDGRHEQDPSSWLAATGSALRRLTAALPRGSVPHAVAVSGTSGTLVRLAADGSPRGPGVMYDDRRGAAELQRVQQVTADQATRLGYRVQPTWALTKIIGLVGELEAGEVIGHQPDVVTGWLAGRRLPSDLSSALKSGADLDVVGWPADVLAELGVDVGDLNPVVGSGTVLGAVGPVGAARTGLPAGCLLVAGTTDGCAAQLAAGALRPGSWNSVLGTTLVIKGAVAQRRLDPTGAVYSHRAPFGEGWYAGGASSTGAGALGHWLPGRDLDRLTAELGPADGWGARPAAYPLVGTGERFPFVAPDATAFSVPGGDRGDPSVLAAVLHGVAWVERLAYDLLDLLGYDVGEAVLLTGGGSRNPVWTQLRADVLQRPLLLPAHRHGAAGMALLAAAGAAAAADPAMPAPLATTATRLLAPPRPVLPSGSGAAQLAQGYAAFLEEIESRGWADPRLLAHARTRAAR